MALDKGLTYIVKGTFYRTEDHDDDDVIQFYQEFKSVDSNKSRLSAFSFFTSCIEILLESINLEFTNFENAQKALSKFYYSGKKEKLITNQLIDLDIDKFISISFSQLECPSHITKSGIRIFDDEKIIHALGYDIKVLHKQINRNLKIEKNLLKNEN